MLMLGMGVEKGGRADLRKRVGRTKSRNARSLNQPSYACGSENKTNSLELLKIASRNSQ